jgi:transposase-like protein
MSIRITGRAVVRCPNQHDCEVDILDPEQLAVQRFTCQLCGAKFSAEIDAVNRVDERSSRASAAVSPAGPR